MMEKDEKIGRCLFITLTFVALAALAIWAGHKRVRMVQSPPTPAAR